MAKRLMWRRLWPRWMDKEMLEDDAVEGDAVFQVPVEVKTKPRGATAKGKATSEAVEYARELIRRERQMHGRALMHGRAADKAHEKYTRVPVETIKNALRRTKKKT